MAVRELIKFPDLTLRWASIRARKPNSWAEGLVQDMFDTMYAHDGVGLAAIQIGTPTRIITLNTPGYSQDLVLVNPKIVAREGTIGGKEGCLSLPGITAHVLRSIKIQVKYRDMAWKPRIMKAEGLLARCIQHEIDHLNGKLIIDYVTEEKEKQDVLR